MCEAVKTNSEQSNVIGGRFHIRSIISGGGCDLVDKII